MPAELQCAQQRGRFRRGVLVLQNPLIRLELLQNGVGLLCSALVLLNPVMEISLALVECLQQFRWSSFPVRFQRLRILPAVRKFRTFSNNRSSFLRGYIWLPRCELALLLPGLEPRMEPALWLPGNGLFRFHALGFIEHRTQYRAAIGCIEFLNVGLWCYSGINN